MFAGHHEPGLRPIDLPRQGVGRYGATVSRKGGRIVVPGGHQLRNATQWIVQIERSENEDVRQTRGMLKNVRVQYN